LQRRNRVDGVRAAEVLRRYVGQAEGAHLSLGDQFGHGADGLLDRGLLAAVVQVVQVDHINAKPSQARLARLQHV
jgi:hypothetical protein